MKKAFFLLIILFIGYFANANWRWVKKADYAGTGRTDCTAFSINGKGYIGNGGDAGTPSVRKDWYSYDPATNSWTKIADFAGAARAEAVGFVIAGKAYIGTGFNGTPLADFYEYNPISNQWTKKADFPGAARRGAFAFSIGNKGYLGSGGLDGSAVTTYKDFYQYNPATNTWLQKANFTASGREYASSFVINDKGYVGCGFSNGNRLGDFWQYDTAGNTWTQKANWGGGFASLCVGFSIAGKGYIGTGYDGSSNLNLFYEYDPLTNKWVRGNDYPGLGIRSSVAFVIGGNAYVGTGHPGFRKEFYAFIPNNKPTNIILSKNTLNENLPVNTIIDTFKTIDPDKLDTVFTYSFVAGTGSTDNSRFIISNGVLKTNQILDFEFKSSYSIRVATNDGVDTFQKQFTINLKDLFEFPPTDIKLSDSTIDENKPVKTFIGLFNTTDKDKGDSFTYKLAAGLGSDNNNKFIIKGDSLLCNKVFDFETDSFYTIRIRTTDAIGFFIEKLMMIYINDLSNSGISGGQPANTFTVYPNPVTDVINIVSTGNSGKSTLELRDLAGKMVYYKEISAVGSNFSTQINANILKSGVYILSVRSDKSINTFKIVVK